MLDVLDQNAVQTLTALAIDILLYNQMYDFNIKLYRTITKILCSGKFLFCTHQKDFGKFLT